jgi:hypothetical protein
VPDLWRQRIKSDKLICLERLPGMEPDVKELFNRAAYFATIERNTNLDEAERFAAWYVLVNRRPRPDLPDAFREWSAGEPANPPTPAT